MNVLSLFDGMSCGMIALEMAGIEVENYFASEIDKFAIKVSKANYPNIKHIGSVIEVKAENLPKIDLLIGGSPCQGFSFAGKQLNFKDPRSKLFFEYVRLLKECKPKYFLLENVVMKKEFQDVISTELGVDPILINSSLVSAQNRKRLYWTNIPDVLQPKDKGILLKDIIDSGIVDREKNHCLTTGIGRATKNRYEKKHHHQIIYCTELELKSFSENSICHHAANATNIKGNESIKRIYADSGKCPTLTTMGGGHREPKILLIPRGNNPGGVRSENGKVGTLTSNSWENNNFLTQDDGFSWRKLTPLECERLQTVPENYTAHVSDSQRYKMLGNGWTIDVIAHIFKSLKQESGK